MMNIIKKLKPWMDIFAKLRLELVRDMLLEVLYEIRALLPEKEWQRLKVDKSIYDATDKMLYLQTLISYLMSLFQKAVF